MNINPDSIITRGEWGVVACAIRQNGTMPAMSFLDDILDKKMKKRLGGLFQRLADQGRITNDQLFNHERGEIWAFKRNKVRIGCFRLGTAWFLTHGFIKKARRWPTTQLDRADNIREEHLQRN